MYLNNMERLVQTGFESLEEAREALAEQRAVWVEEHVPMLEKLAGLPSWSHVGAVNVQELRAFPTLTLYLAKGHKDSPLPREIAQAFHAIGRKDAAYDGESLSVFFKIKDDGEDVEYRLNVEGYLPATCRIEEVEEYIPAHTGKVRKVVCTGGEGDGTTEAA